MTAGIPGLRIERLSVPLRGTDREAILALQHGAFANRWSPETVDGLLASPASRVYVARGADGDTAAFAACYVIADEVHINTIAVASGYRRQGVASALITGPPGRCRQCPGHPRSPPVEHCRAGVVCGRSASR